MKIYILYNKKSYYYTNFVYFEVIFVQFDFSTKENRDYTYIDIWESIQHLDEKQKGFLRKYICIPKTTVSLNRFLTKERFAELKPTIITNTVLQKHPFKKILAVILLFLSIKSERTSIVHYFSFSD